MGRVAAIGVLALLFAGCAGRVRPGEPGDTGGDAIQVPPGLKGEVIAPPGEGMVPPPTERVELQPLPLPDGVAPSDFDIGLQYNGRVAFWLQYYRKYGDTFSSWLERMGRYEPYIRRELTAAGLPGDLIYLALIESGFVSGATSRAQAVGIWQFMAETARQEGLEISTYIDERRDPIRATRAAVNHLRSLYREMGSWYLVAAAYNSGSGRVAKALQAATGGARGADSLFWQIDLMLPRETRDYVPQFIAASILAKYPDRFGLASERREPDEYDTVRIDKPTDLSAVARAARTSEEAVRRMNPQFVRGVTPPGRTVTIRVPAGHADGVRARLAAMPRRERVHNLRHSVDGGETPQSIARAYGVSLVDLRKANHLKKKTRHLAQGRELVIPLVPPAQLASADKKPSKRSFAREKLAAGDGRDALDRDVAAPSDSARARDESGGKVTRTAAKAASPEKKRLASADGDDAGPGSPKKRLSTASDLASPSSTEHRGSASAAKPAPTRPLAHADASGTARRKATAAGANKHSPSGRSPQARSAAKRLVYRVRPGDTLSGIARRHGVTVRELREWNGIDKSDVLRAGERMEIRPGG